MDTWLIENPGITGLLFIMSLIIHVPSYMGVQSVKTKLTMLDQSTPEFEDAIEAHESRSIWRGASFVFVAVFGAFLLAGLLAAIF